MSIPNGPERLTVKPRRLQERHFWRECGADGEYYPDRSRYNRETDGRVAHLDRAPAF